MFSTGKYTVEKEIGKGSFATVYKGHLTTPNEEENNPNNSTNVDSIAVKAVSRSKLKNKKLLENLEIEIAILKKIKHPHIVGLIDCERTSSDFYLIMEYCALGDLTFLIKKRQELIDNHPLLRTVFTQYPPPSNEHSGLHRAFVLTYLQQLVSALKFLRSRNLVHRDIKPQNLLLATPLVGYSTLQEFHALGYVGISSLPILKIADFGFARFLPNTSLAETLCGSPLYMAPEILNYQKYNAKADLWSVGTVLFEMCCGKPPFKASNHLELYKKIKTANNVINFPANVEIKNDLKELICKLLTFDPAERIGFKELFENDLVNMDLSHYEISGSLNELEATSKNCAESNLFISEYLQKPKKKRLDFMSLKENDSKNSYNKRNTFTEEASIERNTNAILQNSSIGLQHEPILEKDYVVVEKKSVEVNSLADEFAHLNTRHPDYNNSDVSPKNIQYPNNNKHLTSSTSVNDRTVKSPRPSPSKNGSTNAVNAAQRRPSLVDRRLSISSLNPSNALSKAIVMASTKLFGSTNNNNGNDNGNILSPKYLAPDVSVLNQNLFRELTENILLHTEHLGISMNVPTDIDVDGIIRILESYSAKAFSIYSFAEVKFAQIIPLPGSDTILHSWKERLVVNNGQYIGDETVRDTSNGRISAIPQLHTSNDMPQGELHHLSVEASMLYVKSLTILARAMNLTSTWWYKLEEKRTTARLNMLVQWMRDRFNECLNKADFLRAKLKEMETDNKKNGIQDIEAGSFEEPVFLGKLLYDRALEIAKTAAKLEIQGEHLSSCELAYATSLWLLDSLLDPPATNDRGKSGEETSNSNITNHNEGKVSVLELDDNDKQIIRKYINSIANRLKSLRQKMDTMQDTNVGNLATTPE